MSPKSVRVILLPGLDGTGKLFGRFIAAKPPNLTVTAAAISPFLTGFGEIAEQIAGDLPDSGPIVVIAESFSGPIAVELTKLRALAGLVFCNSFVMRPRSAAWRLIISRQTLELGIPHFLLRRYMIGTDVDDDLVQEVANTIASIPAAVLAARLESVFTADVSETFCRCEVSTLYVRGTDDKLVPATAWRRIAALRPVDVALVPGPHLILQANPAGAWRVILPFLNALRLGD